MKSSVVKKKKLSVFRIVLLICLLFYVLVYAAVLIYTFFTACTGEFAYNEATFMGKFIFPRKAMLYDEEASAFANRTGWFFCNFKSAFSNFTQEAFVHGEKKTYGIVDMFSFSILYSVLCAGAYVIASTMVAYACATYKNIVAKVLETVVLFVIVFPIIGSTASEMQVIRYLNIYNTFWGMFILKFSFTNTYFLLLLGAFKLIPNTFREAAKIDGASELRIMLEVILPMAKNTIGTVFLIQFIAFWNDYSTPVLYLPGYPTLSFGLAQFNFKSSLSVPLRMCACLICAIPITILFVAFNGKLLNNTTVGGVKY